MQYASLPFSPLKCSVVPPQKSHLKARIMLTTSSETQGKSVVSSEKTRKVFKHGCQTISERSGECWLLIVLKKCFVLLCPIGEQQRLSWDVFMFSNTTAIVSPYLSGSLTKVVHARETVIFFFPNQKRRNYRWLEKTFRIYGFNTTNLRFEFRHFS